MAASPWPAGGKRAASSPPCEEPALKAVKLEGDLQAAAAAGAPGSSSAASAAAPRTVVAAGAAAAAAAQMPEKERRKLWMRYLRSRAEHEGKGKSRVERCPAEILKKIDELKRQLEELENKMDQEDQDEEMGEDEHWENDEWTEEEWREYEAQTKEQEDSKD